MVFLGLFSASFIVGRAGTLIHLSLSFGDSLFLSFGLSENNSPKMNLMGLVGVWESVLPAVRVETLHACAAFLFFVRRLPAGLTLFRDVVMDYGNVGAVTTAVLDWCCSNDSRLPAWGAAKIVFAQTPNAESDCCFAQHI